MEELLQKHQTCVELLTALSRSQLLEQEFPGCFAKGRVSTVVVVPSGVSERDINIAERARFEVIDVDGEVFASISYKEAFAKGLCRKRWR